MKILCLYPMDETTLFLNPIFDFLSNMDSFKGIRFESNEKDVELAIDAIKTCDEDTIIIFLGHGEVIAYIKVIIRHLLEMRRFICLLINGFFY